MNFNTKHYDRRTKRPRGAPKKDTSQPPRQRAGKIYAGGKRLRRALENLAIRNTRHGEDIARGHERGDSFYKPGSPSRQIAGSMKSN